MGPNLGYYVNRKIQLMAQDTRLVNFLIRTGESAIDQNVLVGVCWICNLVDDLLKGHVITLALAEDSLDLNFIGHIIPSLFILPQGRIDTAISNP